MPNEGALLLACPHCGHPYRCELYASIQNLSVKQHYTCSKCKRGYALGDITAANVAAHGLAALMAALEEHVAKHPDDRAKARDLAALLAKRAEAYVERGEMKNAGHDLRRACELDPENQEYAALRDRVFDELGGPAQIQELIGQRDFNMAILMLSAYCSRHPEEAGGLQSLAALYNQRAVQSANIAQKLLDQRARPEYEDECFLRDLGNTVVLTTSESSTDLSKHPDRLLHIALADAALAADLAPHDSTVAANFDAISGLARQLGISARAVKEIAERARSARPNAPSRPKRRGLFGWLSG